MHPDSENKSKDELRWRETGCLAVRSPNSDAAVLQLDVATTLVEEHNTS